MEESEPLISPTIVDPSGPLLKMVVFSWITLSNEDSACVHCGDSGWMTISASDLCVGHMVDILSSFQLIIHMNCFNSDITTCGSPTSHNTPPQWNGKMCYWKPQPYLPMWILLQSKWWWLSGSSRPLQLCCWLWIIGRMCQCSWLCVRALPSY